LCAQCSCSHDIEMIWTKILKAGGFQRLNEAILWFRASVISQEAGHHEDLLTQLANSVLDRFNFPKEIDDPHGYGGHGVTMNRTKIAIKVLGQGATADEGRALFKTLGDKAVAENSKIFDCACGWSGDREKIDDCIANSKLINPDPAGLQKLMNDGADAFCIIKGKNPKTSLQIAAKFGNKDCCEILIKAGLDPHENFLMRSDGSGRRIERPNAVRYAMKTGHNELAAWLTNEGCMWFLQKKLGRQIDLSMQDQLWSDAAAAGKGLCRGEAMELAYAVFNVLGFPKEIVTPKGYYAGVISDRRSTACKILLEEPTLTKGRERFEHMAKELPHLNGVVFDCMEHKDDSARLQKALDSGADAFALAKVKGKKDGDGNFGYDHSFKTALMVAAKWNARKCCEVLIKAGLDPKDVGYAWSDRSGRQLDFRSPAQFAKDNKHPELAAWLNSLPSALPYR